MSFIRLVAQSQPRSFFAACVAQYQSKKDYPSVGVLDSCQVLSSTVPTAFSIGVSARSLINRVVFHKHIGAESYQFMAVRCHGRVRVSVGISARSLSGFMVLGSTVPAAVRVVFESSSDCRDIGARSCQ